MLKLKESDLQSKSKYLSPFYQFLTSLSPKHRFDKQLRDKISQKNYQNVNDQVFISKQFKYFDVMNKGKVDFDQFRRAVEKIGVVQNEFVSINKNIIFINILISIGYGSCIQEIRLVR